MLNERGHCKGDYEDEFGSVCAFGAINLASHGDASHDYDPTTSPGKEAATRLMDAVGVKHPYQIPEWNDSDLTTPEDVKLAFKRAIAGESA